MLTDVKKCAIMSNQESKVQKVNYIQLVRVKEISTLKHYR